MSSLETFELEFLDQFHFMCYDFSMITCVCVVILGSGEGEEGS